MEKYRNLRATEGESIYTGLYVIIALDSVMIFSTSMGISMIMNA
jgi:hypothetical protein